MVYTHTAVELAVLIDLEPVQHSKKRPKCLVGGDVAVVRIKTKHTMCVEPRDDGNGGSLSRLVLRMDGRTVAAGFVLSI